MKKILLITIIFGIALNCKVQGQTITSPIFMPKAKEIVTNLSIGYTTSKLKDTPANTNKSIEKSKNIILEGKYGATNTLSINYGLNFDFSRTMNNLEENTKFTNFYLGATGRIIDTNKHKLDIIFNIGQETNKLPIIINKEQIYKELFVRYGLNLDKYNMGLSLGGKSYNDYKEEDINTTTLAKEKIKIQKNTDIIAKFENELILTKNFTLGLDLFYKNSGAIKIKAQNAPTEKTKSYSEYGFNIDTNYIITENAIVGFYFTKTLNNIKLWQDNNFKNQDTYKFGLKLISKF